MDLMLVDMDMGWNELSNSSPQIPRLVSRGWITCYALKTCVCVCVCVWREGRFDEGDQLHYTIYIGKQTATLMQIPFCTPFVPMTLHPPAPRQERAKKDLYRF